MGVEHCIVFLASQVPDFQTPVDASLSVVKSCSLQQTKPVVNELLGVFSRRTKVDEFNLETKVEYPFDEVISYIRTWRFLLFHKKLVQFGSVCITLNTKSSFRQSSIIREAIYSSC